MKKQVLYFIISIMLISTAYAEISINKLDDVYTIGDSLDISVNILSDVQRNDFLKMYLECANNTKEFYLAPISLNAAELKIINSSVILTNSFLGEVQGRCIVKAETSLESVASNSFEITNAIDLIINSDKVNYNPGDNVLIEMTASKPNEEAIDGFLQLELANTDVKVTKRVSENKVSLSFTLPEDIKSGRYQLSALLYEKDQAGEETNKGYIFIPLQVSQQASKIDISVDTLSIKPEGNITFRIMMYDQANDIVQGDATIKITDPVGDLYLEKLVKTGENIIFPIELNFTVGYWSIEASSNTLNTKILFFVEKKEEAEFDIIGDKLTVTNIGNAPYQKTIQISIGDENELRQMNIDVGNFVEFRLLAPEGLYKVSVTDGEKSLSIDNIALTGNIIGVVGLSGKRNIFASYPLVWIFLVIVVGMFILIMLERFFRRGVRRMTGNVGSNIKSIEKKPTEFNKKGSFYPTPMLVQYVSRRPMRNGHAYMTLGSPNIAEHTASLHGTKQEAALVGINIKNINDVKNSLILEDIERSFKSITENKGLLYKSSGYVIGIFTPQITKTFKNADTAVRVAMSVMDALMKYNQTHSFKTNVGIGVHAGEIIVDAQGKFTSLGNTLLLTKKLAELANQEIVLSKDVRAKIGNEYKAEKRFQNGINIYVLSQIYDRDEHKKFLQGFLKRNFE